MQNPSQKWVRISIIAIATVVILSYAIVPEWARLHRKHDLAGAVSRSAIARVAILVPGGRANLGDPTEAQVSVRFQGELYSVKQPGSTTGLTADGQAQIEYRVGKSGRIYVDTVRPLPPSR
jgi:hypothetical protein